MTDRGTAFGDDGERVLVTMPTGDHDDEIVGPADRALIARTVVDLVSWLTSNGDVVSTGKRAVLLAAALGLGTVPKTTRELGAAIGCSHTGARLQVSKVQRELPDILGR